MLLTPFVLPSGLFPNTLPLLCKLRQWGKVVVAICQIRIVDSAIMFCHGKGAVSQQLLEHKGIPAAIHKVLSKVWRNRWMLVRETPRRWLYFLIAQAKAFSDIFSP